MKRKKLALFSEVISTRTLETAQQSIPKTEMATGPGGEKHTEGSSQSHHQQSCLHSQKIIKAHSWQVTRMAYAKKKMHWGSPLHTAPKIQLIICISYSMKAFQFLRWNNWREKLPNNDKLSFLGISRHKCWDTWSLICGKHTIVHCSHKQVYIFKCILGAIKCHRFFFAFLWSQICKTYIPEKNYSRMSREAMYFCSAWEVKLHCGKHLKWFRW